MDDRYKSEINRGVPPAQTGEFDGVFGGIKRHHRDHRAEGFDGVDIGMLAGVIDHWLPGGSRQETDRHPFQKHFDELEIGDAILTGIPLLADYGATAGTHLLLVGAIGIAAAGALTTGLSATMLTRTPAAARV